MLVSLPRKQTIADINGHAHSRQVNAYDKFMGGFDTLQVAAHYHISEPCAHRWISQERSRRHEQASPYEARP